MTSHDLNSSQPLLEMTAVGRAFSTGDASVRALQDITFSIAQGEYVSFSGPSGCGKSTLLAILGLLDSPTEGQYTIKGIDVARLSATETAKIRNAEIGYVFQDFNLLGDLNILENVELPLTQRDMKRADRRARAMECLELVGMADKAPSYPYQLSGGQQQRVAVARAVVGRPSLLLADEPTGNLDSSNGDAVMSLLASLNATQKTTICMVTHDVRYAAAAPRTIRLFDGRLAEEAAHGH